MMTIDVQVKEAMEFVENDSPHRVSDKDDMALWQRVQYAQAFLNMTTFHAFMFMPN